MTISALLWAWHADRRSAQANQQHRQYHLYDAQAPAPAPNRAAHYLLTVCTGHRPNAGTTATVSARVHGTRYSTGTVRLHRHSNSRAFARGAIDHYRLRTPVEFGRVLSVTLSHNAAGRRPSWFCEWVRVRDLRHREDWLFDVRRWLSLLLAPSTAGGDPLLSVRVRPMDERTFGSRRRCLSRHWRQRLAERSVWYGLVIDGGAGSDPTPGHQQRRHFTRVHRVTLAAVSLVCSLLTNVMFFGRTDERTMETEQRDEYARLVVTSVRVAVVGVQSVLIATVGTAVVSGLLRWSARRAERRAAAEQRGNMEAVEDGRLYRIMFADNGREV